MYLAPGVCLRLSLDGVPPGIDIEKIKKTALATAGIIEIHHLHVWAISTTQNALTAHITVDGKATMQEVQLIKDHLKHSFEHMNIQHTTLETEAGDVDCKKKEC